MRTLFCPPPLSVSGAIIMSSPCIFPPSTKTPPSKKKKKKLELPPHHPYPLRVTGIMRNCPPPPAHPLCLPPHSEHAFLEGSLLFIPSGGLTVNLCTGGKFLGAGPTNVCGYSKWTSIYLSNYPSQHNTASSVFPPSLLLLLHSARMVGLASSSFHFQPQQTERLH